MNPAPIYAWLTPEGSCIAGGSEANGPKRVLLGTKEAAVRAEEPAARAYGRLYDLPVALFRFDPVQLKA